MSVVISLGASMTGSVVPPNPQKEGLEKAGELLKLTLSLSTGALVFGAALVKEQLDFSGATKWAVIGAWVLLSLAAASGILAISAIPMMVAKSNYDLEDKFLTWPARVHQVTFIIGIVLLGFALASSLLKASKPKDEKPTGTVNYIMDSHDSASSTETGCRHCCRHRGTPSGQSPANLP